MARFLESFRKAKGAAPGSLIFMGEQEMEIPKITLFTYDQVNSFEKEFKGIDEALQEIAPDQINWLNIDGLHDTSIMRTIGKHFNISALTLDSILNTGQRSRYSDDSNSLSVIAKAIFYKPETSEISIEQVSFILCKNVLISFQEKPGDHFDPVRERIRTSIGQIRKMPSDYLLYALLDSLVDNYLIIIEQIGTRIEDLEDRLSEPDKELSDELFMYKTEVTFLRKTIRPFKEVMTRIIRFDSDYLSKQTHVYFQELNDLTEHSIEAIEVYFNMIGDHMNLYHMNVDRKANDVMKVLTIFASIFIPLTFLAGIYGTNFDFIPELHYKYGYFTLWGVMIVIALIMLYFFKKNKWF